MHNPNKATLTVAAAGGLLLGVAGIMAATASTPDVFNVDQQQWSNLMVALGLIGYAAAVVVAAFGTRRPRHVLERRG